MSLQVKILLIVLAVVSLYAVSDYASQYFFILPSFVSLERNEAQNTMRRCVGALKREITNLDKFTGEWAARDDTYQFVKERNDDYISTNPVIKSFTNNNLGTPVMQKRGWEPLGLIYICDIKGEVVWGEIRDLATNERMLLDEFPDGFWPETHPLLGHKTVESSTAGVFITERGPMLVASRPVITSKNEGPIRGTLIVGRFLNDNLLKAIVEQVRVDLKVWTIAKGSGSQPRSNAAGVPSIPAKERDVLNHVKTESQFHIREHSENFLHIYTVLSGLQGAPVLLMRADIPRDIRAKGIAGLIRSSFLSNLTAGLIVLLVLLVLLRSTVVSPIRKLTNWAIATGKSDTISARFTMERSDEIGTLAREFRRMVEQLAESRRKFAEQSYHLGKAEVASGILHNVRNVLTPMISRIDGLRQKFRKVPIGKIETAQTELADGSPSGERKEDLARFISLANKSLVTLVRETRDKLDDVAEHVAQIEEMLYEQSKFSHAELPTEEVKLDKLVRDSIALLPNDLYDLISIEIDPSLEAIEPIVTHSITLLQVFNNILLNAAESIHRAGAIHGEIRIRAETGEINGVDMVHVQLSDNGEGVEPCNLVHIFERGFSTKTKRNVPSGIGLHWCANTIASMNGQIYAESEGRGHGACFHILLPAFHKIRSVLKEKAEVKA